MSRVGIRLRYVRLLRTEVSGNRTPEVRVRVRVRVKVKVKVKGSSRVDFGFRVQASPGPLLHRLCALLELSSLPEGAW